MTASAPSRIALATSDASARVGRELVIIDSIIWVATITGLALRRHSSIRRFCTIGTFSSGYSTARSPRATMTPSKAVDDVLHVVDRLRLLDLGDDRDPAAHLVHDPVHVAGRRSASRTKDSATMSQPIRRAKRRSSTSFSDSAGTFTAAPGRLMPLWSEMTPPSMTMRPAPAGPSTSMTCSSTLPSLIRIGSPLETSPGQALVGGAADGLVAGDVLGGDDELVAAHQLDGALGEGLQADLGALEVGEHADGAAGLLGGLADAVVPLLVLRRGCRGSS